MFHVFRHIYWFSSIILNETVVGCYKSGKFIYTIFIETLIWPGSSIDLENRRINKSDESPCPPWSNPS